jgi:hypothetical protein
MLQQLIVATLVALAFGYTAWTLMPAGGRQALRRLLGASGASSDAGACGGCGGCASASAPPQAGGAVAVIKLHRRAAAPDVTPRPGGSAGAAAP